MTPFDKALQSLKDADADDVLDIRIIQQRVVAVFESLSTTPARAEAPSDDLRTACKAVLDDYQTSDAHHPDHVLIRRTDFDRIKALVEAPVVARAEAQDEGAAGEWPALAIAQAEYDHWIKEALKHKRPKGLRSDCENRDLERARIAKRILDKIAAHPSPTPAADADRVRIAVEAIRVERQRQVEVEGWSEGHDDEHDDYQMARAAGCYALNAGRHDTDEDFFDSVSNAAISHSWPWDRSWWKPKDRRSDLIRAGALIVAEIERLDRAALKSEGK